MEKDNKDIEDVFGIDLKTKEKPQFMLSVDVFDFEKDKWVIDKTFDNIESAESHIDSLAEKMEGPILLANISHWKRMKIDKEGVY